MNLKEWIINFIKGLDVESGNKFKKDLLENTEMTQEDFNLPTEQSKIAGPKEIKQQIGSVVNKTILGNVSGEELWNATKATASQIGNAAVDIGKTSLQFPSAMKSSLQWGIEQLQNYYKYGSVNPLQPNNNLYSPEQLKNVMTKTSNKIKQKLNK